MAVGTDVLDGRSTGKAGDFGEGFDAGIIVFAGIIYGVIPDGAAHDGESAVFVGDALDGVFDEDAVKAFVVAESVGATTDDESGEIMRFGKIVGFDDVGFVFYFDEKTGRAAEAHSSKSRNRNVFCDFHRTIIAFLVGGCKMILSMIDRKTEDRVGVV